MGQARGPRPVGPVNDVLARVQPCRLRKGLGFGRRGDEDPVSLTAFWAWPRSRCRRRTADYLGLRAPRPRSCSSLGTRAISYSKTLDPRRTRLAHAFRSSPAAATLSAATSAVKRWMPSWRARSDSWASNSVPSPRRCQSSTIVTAISAACGSPGVPDEHLRTVAQHYPQGLR